MTAPETGTGEVFAPFASPEAVTDALRDVNYLPNADIATTTYLGSALGKPVLIEGPAGTGKTELARSVAIATGARLLRLQCYEGLDEAKALYEWDYRKQLLRLQAGDGASADWSEASSSIFDEEFLLARPLLDAIRSDQDTVLLIDEVDRLDTEAEALLLEILSDFQVSIPELGTIAARRRPLVYLTSNSSRDLSDALKRRCLYLYLDYPDVDREAEIVVSRVPDVTAELGRKIAAVVQSLRGLELKKPPSVSETLDWARSLVLLGIEELTSGDVVSGLPVLLKNRGDMERATSEFGERQPA